MSELTFAAFVPMLPVSDVPRTIAFYEQLGFQVGNTHVPEGETQPVWAWLYNGKAHVMINRASQQVAVTHESVACWLYCTDVEAVYETLKARGLDVGEISYPFYNPRGEFHVHDPDGYAIFVAHAD